MIMPNKAMLKYRIAINLPPLLFMNAEITILKIAPVTVGQLDKIAFQISNKCLHFDKIGPYNDTADNPVNWPIVFPI